MYCITTNWPVLTRAVLLAATSFPLYAFSAPDTNLETYYAAALQRSETISIQTELIHQAQEHYQQANSGLLPTISGEATYTKQDPLPPSSPQTPSNLSSQRVVKVTATQPLFRGMREFAALRQNQALITAQSEAAQHARVLLFKDVVQNFYAILAIESDLANYGEEVRLNQDREKDIRSRVNIGRSRVSELLNVQSTISTLHAQIEQLRGQLRVAREIFAFQSGLAADTALHDTEVLPDKLAALDEYLAGIVKRPDVVGAENRLLAASEGVSIARGSHLPSLDLNGNYYFERPGYLDDSKWDVQLALTIPLYAGGSVQSKVREAGSIQSQAELTQNQTKRQAGQEIRSYYQSVIADITQLAALENATTVAKKSYDAQLKEYRLGLVINLDVLQSLTVYQQNQRALDRARLATKTDYLYLLAAAAHRPARQPRENP